MLSPIIPAQLLRMVDPSRLLAVRCPPQWQAAVWQQPVQFGSSQCSLAAASSCAAS
eukprot:COSAG01_NODE_33_length_35013_cov_86.824144_19_plen_56_part_00